MKILRHVLTTVTYRDVCAECITTSTLRSTDKLCRSINEDDSEKLLSDIYVDDVTSLNSRLHNIIKNNMGLMITKGSSACKEFVGTRGG